LFPSKPQERWLLEMESAMRDSLKDIGTKALEAYPLSVRTQFVQEWTGMIVLAADNYFWTKDVEQGMRSMGLEGVKKVEGKMKTDLADIVTLVRGSISKQVR
jgi:dynein heavy chain